MSNTTSSGASRHTIARHGELHSPRAFSQLFKLVAIAVVTVLVATVGVAAFVLGDMQTRFTASAVDIGGPPVPDVGEIKGGLNILVAGTDVCEPQYAQYFGDRCGDGAEEGARSDVNLLMHISDEPRRVTVISFPRDMMVPIPDCKSADGSTRAGTDKEMINAAFDRGGLGCTVATVEKLTGLDIQYAASVNWGGVIEMTNAIGGVTVCLASGIKDEYTGIDWPAGDRTIQGLEALQFLRTRHGVGNGGDLGRISNQQQYMSRLVKKMMSSEVLSNPVTVLKLANTALEAIDPSTSLTDPNTLLKIANTIKGVPFEDFVFVQYPTEVDPDNANRVVPSTSAAEALLAALAANQPIQLSGGAGVGVLDQNAAAAADPTAVPSADPSAEAANPESTETPAPESAVASASETPAPSGTPEVNEAGRVVLPQQVTGQNAAQNTCSNGNMRNN